jgi:hypothetical protein
LDNPLFLLSLYKQKKMNIKAKRIKNRLNRKFSQFVKIAECEENPNLIGDYREELLSLLSDIAQLAFDLQCGVYDEENEAGKGNDDTYDVLEEYVALMQMFKKSNGYIYNLIK